MAPVEDVFPIEHGDIQLPSFFFARQYNVMKVDGATPKRWLSKGQ